MFSHKPANSVTGAAHDQTVQVSRNIRVLLNGDVRGSPPEVKGVWEIWKLTTGGRLLRLEDNLAYFLYRGGILILERIL